MGCTKETDLNDLGACEPASPEPAQANQDYAGDPVNLVTGAFTLEERDVVFPCQRLRLALVRHYDNQRHNREVQPGPFGWGWFHSFSLRIEAVDGLCWYVDDRGNRLEFKPGAVVGSYVAPPGGLALALERDGEGAFRLRQGDGLRAHFDAAGRLTSLVRPGPREDCRLDVGYDRLGRLAWVEGAGGRSLRFAYRGSSPLVRCVEDHTQRTWTYDYDADDQLIAVCDPLGGVRRYAYETWSGEVTGVVEEGGSRRVELQPREVRGLSRVFAPTRSDGPRVPLVTNQYTSDFRVHRQTDALGHVTRFDYNLFSRLTFVTDPEGWTSVHAFDHAGNTTRCRTPEGATTEYFYDDRRNLLAVVDPLGHRTEFVTLRDTEAWDRVAEFGQRALGNRSEYMVLTDEDMSERYDERGRRPLVRDELGRTTRFADYDEFGTPRHTRLADGGEILIETDRRSGLPLRRVWRGRPAEGGQRIDVWEHDALGNVTVHRRWWEDPDGKRGPLQVEVRTYDEHGHHPITRSRVITVDGEDSPPVEERFSWSARGELLVHGVSYRRRPGEAPTEIVTQLGHDTLGRLTSRLHADGVAKVFEYDVSGRVAETFWVKDAEPESLGRVPVALRLRRQRWTYDPMGHQWEAIDPAGAIRRTYWDACGRCRRIEGPAGAAVEYSYDRDGRIIGVETPTGEVIRLGYDPAGRLTTRRDGFQTETLWNYDAVGRLLTSTERDGTREAKTVQTWDDSMGTVERCYPDRTSESLRFDAWGRLIERISGSVERCVERFTFDGLGRVTGVEAGDPTGPRLLFSYRYNDVNGVVTVADALHHEAVLHYDGLGRLVERVDADGRAVVFDYDVRGRLAGRRSGDGGIVSWYDYDFDGALIGAGEGDCEERWERDETGRIRFHHQALHGRRLTVAYNYDDSGRISVKSAGDRWSVRFDYRGESPLPACVHLLGRSLDIEVDSRGRVFRELWDDGLGTEYRYAGSGEVVGISVARGADVPLFAQQVDLDVAGRPERESFRRGMQVERFFYHYDAQNRLDRVDRDEERREHRRYQHDALGNRLVEYRDERRWRVSRFDAAQRFEETTDGAGQALPRAYDRSGNLVRSGELIIEYDSLGRTRRISRVGEEAPIAEYRYTATDRPAVVLSTDGVTRWYVDGDQVIVIEGAGVQCMWWQGGNRLLAWKSASGALPEAVCTDRLGSVVTCGDGRDHRRYGPFGELVLAAESGPPFGYAGKAFVADTGLYFNRSRFYDSVSGRFTQPDPLGVIDGPNVYVFARNNPICYADISGLAAERTAQGTLSNAQSLVDTVDSGGGAEAAGARADLSSRVIVDDRVHTTYPDWVPVHRIGGGDWENLQLSPRELRAGVQRISVIAAGSPDEVVSEFRARGLTRRAAEAEHRVASAVVGDIRRVGFDVAPAPTLNLPSHAQLKHESGVGGFVEANLRQLSGVFREQGVGRSPGLLE